MENSIIGLKNNEHILMEELKKELLKSRAEASKVLKENKKLKSKLSILEKEKIIKMSSISELEGNQKLVISEMKNEIDKCKKYIKATKKENKEIGEKINKLEADN